MPFVIFWKADMIACSVEPVATYSEPPVREDRRACSVRRTSSEEAGPAGITSSHAELHWLDRHASALAASFCWDTFSWQESPAPGQPRFWAHWQHALATVAIVEMSCSTSDNWR
jgi:hypothetical protein